MLSSAHHRSAIVFGLSLLVSTLVVQPSLGKVRGAQASVTGAVKTGMLVHGAPAAMTGEAAESHWRGDGASAAGFGLRGVLDVSEPVSLESMVASMNRSVKGIDPQLECMAKVVHHEAANQSARGQLAVAQVMLNRVKSAAFPKTICAVANQRGQFFDTHAYSVPVSSPRWRTAVAISQIARLDSFPQVVPGALFYHAAYVTPSWSKHRTLISRIEGHVFYR
ncbi:hypothetical protein BH11PSE2_BH11PSE2_11330 [soil metagenome]